MKPFPSQECGLQPALLVSYGLMKPGFISGPFYQTARFVAYLAELAEQSEQHETINLARRRFQAEHLQPWLSRFAADLQQHTTVAFYNQVGKLLAGLGLQIESN